MVNASRAPMRRSRCHLPRPQHTAERPAAGEHHQQDGRREREADDEEDALGRRPSVTSAALMPKSTIRADDQAVAERVAARGAAA